jgi:hypothetical protein
METEEKEENKTCLDYEFDDRRTVAEGHPTCSAVQASRPTRCFFTTYVQVAVNLITGIMAPSMAFKLDTQPQAFKSLAKLIIHSSLFDRQLVSPAMHTTKSMSLSGVMMPEA